MRRENRIYPLPDRKEKTFRNPIILEVKFYFYRVKQKAKYAPPASLLSLRSLPLREANSFFPSQRREVRGEGTCRFRGAEVVSSWPL